MAPSQDREAKRLKGVGLGAELAAALAGSALLGLWIDRHYGTAPWGVMISLAVGIVGGSYNFIRSSLRILRPPPTSISKATSESTTTESESTHSEG